MRQWSGIASGSGVSFFGATPLHEPMVTYQDILSKSLVKMRCLRNKTGKKTCDNIVSSL